MDWSLLGGDPAPGDVGGVRSSGLTLTGLAGNVGAVIGDLQKGTGACAPERWSGPAAEQFRDRAVKLPDKLYKARESFDDAGLALAHYADLLDGLQADARRALDQATAAVAALHDARGRESACRGQLDAVQGAQLQVTANLGRLALWKRGAIVSGDTAAVQNYQQQAAVQRADQRRLNDDAHALNDQIRHLRHHLDAAQGELDRARRRADDIRDSQHRAGEALKGALKHAHDAGINQSLLARIEHAAEDLKKVLDVLSLVCSIAAIFCPALAPIAFGLAALDAGVGLVAHLAKFADGGYPGGTRGLAHFGLDILGDAIGLVPVAGKAAKLKDATTAVKVFDSVGKVTPYLSFARDEAAAALNAHDEGKGWKGTASSMVWVAAEHGTGRVVQGSIAGLAKHSEKSAAVLEGLSKSYGRSDKPARNFVVSLGMSGQQKPGQFSFGDTRILTDGQVQSGLNRIVKGAHTALDEDKRQQFIDNAELPVNELLGRN